MPHKHISCKTLPIWATSPTTTTTPSKSLALQLTSTIVTSEGLVAYRRSWLPHTSSDTDLASIQFTRYNKEDCFLNATGKVELLEESAYRLPIIPNSSMDSPLGLADLTHDSVRPTT